METQKLSRSQSIINQLAFFKEPIEDLDNEAKIEVRNYLKHIANTMHVIEPISVEDLPELLGSKDNHSRHKDLAVSRQIGQALVYVFSSKTLKATGEMFEKHHSTVNHSLKCMDAACATNDKVVMRLLNELFDKLYYAHLQRTKDYIHLTREEKDEIDIINKRLEKYDFTRALIRMY